MSRATLLIAFSSGARLAGAAPGATGGILISISSATWNVAMPAFDPLLDDALTSTA